MPDQVLGTGRWPTLTATVPVGAPPTWAVLQRRLFDALDEAWRAFQDRYAEADGRLRFTGGRLRFTGPTTFRAGADDFYAAFFNWPTLYQLGGHDDLLTASKHHWAGITAQLAELGYLADEYGRSHDRFHQGESMLLFYGICAADPTDGQFRERACRFADLYLTTWADLADPTNAASMDQWLGHGDVVVNLAATSLATNAWLYGHDDRYRDWALHYIDGWRDRTAAHHGILPDGIGTAAVIAAVNTVLLTGGTDRLDIGRAPLDLVLGQGVQGVATETEMTNKPRWLAELGDEADQPTLLVPNRYADGGWFDYQPPHLALATWLWQIAGEKTDADRLDRIREFSGYDWRTVREFHNQEEAGHEAPWLAFLRGDNPSFPEEQLRQALGQIARRMTLIENDHSDPATVHLDHWRWHNPVVTEALLQLTTGTPQVLYNGGLLPTRLAYFDADRRRPGLPRDVAALVDGVDGIDGVDARVRLVNLSLTRGRRVVVQAGSFGGNTITAATLDVAAGDEYPGDVRDHRAGPVSFGRHRIPVNGPRVEVVLPPGRQARLELECRPRTDRPCHGTPWTGS